MLELSGEKENLERAVARLKKLGVKVQSLSKRVEIRRELCMDCSACVPLCPVEALQVKNNEVVFFPEKCIACGVCIKACPVKAIVLNV